MTTVAAPTSFNLFTSLPQDLIRTICVEWDTTYRYVFSTEKFKQEIMEGYLNQKRILKKMSREIYDGLDSFIDDELVFGNRFIHLNLDEEDNVYHFTHQTEGMTQDEIDALPTSTTSLNLEKDTVIYFSRFKDVLRWAIIPKSFENKAHAYFKRREAEQGYIFDGMCSLEFKEQLEPGRSSYYTRIGKIKPVAMANISHIGWEDYFNYSNSMIEFSDAITVKRLRRMSESKFISLIKNNSEREFIVWI